MNLKKRAVICTAICLVSINTIACSSTNTVTTVETKVSNTVTEATVAVSEEIPYDYDVLQTLFINLTSNTTIDELETMIAEGALFYTRQEYNKDNGKSISYKIAYTEGVSHQKYADSGDYINISFDKGNDNKLMFAQYCNQKYLGSSALFYQYGTWYGFSDQNAEDYSGYYVIKSLGDEEVIKIKYTNGNEAATTYFKFDSAEDAIQQIINEND